MFRLLANQNTFVYDYQEFVCDTPDDIEKLPKDCAAGSHAFVIETSDVYMLNSQKEWKKL